MKVAIVPDWMTGYAGAERTIEQIIQCFPDADLFCLFDFVPQSSRGFLMNKVVRTSFIQNLPLAKFHWKKYLPLMPYAVERLDLSPYDLIISSSHAVAKGILTSPDQIHICYLMARNLKYAYEDRAFYPGGTIRRALEDIFLHYLRVWDSVASRRPLINIAPSKYVAQWYRRMHGIDPLVIYPPVDVEYFCKHYCEQKSDGYLVVSRLEPYKRIDVVVEAFNQLGKRLIIYGDGSELRRLESMSGSNIEFRGFQSKENIATALSAAQAFIFPGREDFGIALVEAQACGTPVIALGKGGALESISDLSAQTPTGVFFHEQSAKALVEAIEQFEKNRSKITAEACRENARRFSNEIFVEQFKLAVEQSLSAWRKSIAI